MMALRRLAVNWNSRKSTSMQLLLLASSRTLPTSVLSLSSDLNSSSKSGSVSSLSSSSKLGSVSSFSSCPNTSSKSGSMSSLSNGHFLNFEVLGRQYVIDKIIHESQIADFSDEVQTFASMDCLESIDYGTLKSLLKDLTKYNRKNNNYSKTTLASLQHKIDPPRFCYRLGSKKLDIDDSSICQMARLVVKQYNKEKNSKLEFVTVLRAHRGIINPLEIRILVHACDPVAARVPIKLRALCIRKRNKKYMVEQVQIYKPVPFMICKDETERPSLSRSYTETLLFANIRGCPIINKRLGLKRLRGLRCKKSRPHIVKVSLEDDAVLSLAKFVFNQQKKKQIC